MVVGLLAASGEGSAQEAGQRRAVSITPALTVAETLTDSRRASDGSLQADSITTVSPSLRISVRGARVAGSLDYSLSALLYARDTPSNHVQHRLNAALVAQPVEDHLAVDLRGNVARQAVSALTLQTPEGTATRQTQTHVKTFSVAPVLTGRPGGLVDASARLDLSTTDSGSTALSDSTAGTLSLQLGSVNARTRLGWFVSASRQVIDFDRGRRTEEDRIVGGLAFQVDPELRLDLRAGVEDSDVASLTKQRHDTWGLGLLWTPTERTRLSVSGDRRAFGHSHALNFQHRMRRSVWRYTDRQDVSSGTNASAAGVPAFDLFFALFASQEPDPVLREQLVNSFLQRNNLSPTALVNGGLLTSASAVQRQRELSLAVQGIRTTVIFSGFQSNSRRAYELLDVNDDLAAGGLRQRGLSFTLTHRLTPTSSVAASLTSSQAVSELGVVRSAIDMMTLNWTERLGPRTNVTLGLRHSESETNADHVRENALLANLYLLF